MTKRNIIHGVFIAASSLALLVNSVTVKPVAAKPEYKRTSGDCLADRVTGDLFPQPDGYCVNNGHKAVNDRGIVSVKVWSVEHTDEVSTNSCTFVTVVINEYHSYEVCQ